MPAKTEELRSQGKAPQKPGVERKPGGLEGQIWMSPDFDEPDEELIDLMEKSEIFPDERATSRK